MSQGISTFFGRPGGGWFSWSFRSAAWALAADIAERIGFGAQQGRASAGLGGPAAVPGAGRGLWPLWAA
jgi:hypothetical protein